MRVQWKVTALVFMLCCRTPQSVLTCLWQQYWPNCTGKKIALPVPRTNAFDCLVESPVQCTHRKCHFHSVVSYDQQLILVMWHRKCHLRSVVSSDQQVILVMWHWLMWCHSNQLVTLWLKVEHFSWESEHFYSFAWLSLGDSTMKLQTNLVKFVGSEDSTRATVRRWYGLFHSEDKGKKTASPFGHPKTALNEESMSAVLKIVKADPHLNVCMWEISLTLALLLGTVPKILHDSLYMRKLAAKLIPHGPRDIQKACLVDTTWSKQPKTCYQFVYKSWNWDIFLWYCQQTSEYCLALPWRWETSDLQAGFSKQE